MDNDGAPMHWDGNVLVSCPSPLVGLGAFAPARPASPCAAPLCYRAEAVHRGVPKTVDIVVGANVAEAAEDVAAREIRAQLQGLDATVDVVPCPAAARSIELRDDEILVIVRMRPRPPSAPQKRKRAAPRSPPVARAPPSV